MSALSKDIRRLLNRYNVKPRKKQGQSFLISQSMARDIVGLANLSEEDEVLEIGGGLGILTKWIAEKAQQVYVVEIDPGLLKALRDTLRDFSNVNIIGGNALSVDLPEVNKVVANLPYSISSDITFRILNDIQFETAILMYQKEFASRLVALPGTPEYSRLSINVQYYADVDSVLEVPANLFYPVPAVDSTVVRITPRSKGPFAKNDRIFHWMIGGIYPYPNKTLRKALQIWCRNLGVERSISDRLLQHLEGTLSGKERLRSLSLDKLVALSDALLMFVEEGTIADPRE
ncbi:MAG: 16S rRNA (adenine(1518)-N(6)/adenine(1519)-N(6))-dimethyltransferase RsmA [Candidatus Thorarchaeota archaeon]